MGNRLRNPLGLDFAALREDDEEVHPGGGTAHPATEPGDGGRHVARPPDSKSPRAHTSSPALSRLRLPTNSVASAKYDLDQPWRWM